MPRLPLSLPPKALARLTIPKVSRVVTDATKHKHSMVKAKAALREQAFIGNLHAARVPLPSPEWRFHPSRKWRFDFAWIDERLALEVDGGVWSGGKHGRGSGIVKDHEKQNAAAVLGWRILRITPRQLTDPATAALVRDALTPSRPTP
mgnify:CR=1 FL=1